MSGWVCTCPHSPPPLLPPSTPRTQLVCQDNILSINYLYVYPPSLRWQLKQEQQPDGAAPSSQTGLIDALVNCCSTLLPLPQRNVSLGTAEAMVLAVGAGRLAVAPGEEEGVDDRSFGHWAIMQVDESWWCMTIVSQGSVTNVSQGSVTNVSQGCM